MIKQYEFIDSYEKALAFFVLRLEKTGNEFLQSLDLSNATTDDYIYYLKHYCNIGIVLNDFSFSIAFSIPFDEDYYLNQNGTFYDSIITSNESLEPVDLPLPFFQSIFTYIPLNKPPDYVNTIEKYIVWLSYQMKKGGSDIDIIHQTNVPNEFSKFLINSRNLTLFQKKGEFLSNPDYPQYDIQIEQGFIEITHILNLDKSFLFRYGNFTNAILPEITKNPQVVLSNNTKFSIVENINNYHTKIRIFKPLGIKWKTSSVFKTIKSVKRNVYRQFADIGMISNFVSESNGYTSLWFNTSTFDSEKETVRFMFTWLVSQLKYNSEQGKLDSRIKYNTEYKIYSGVQRYNKLEKQTEYKVIKNYIYKNLISQNR